MQFYSDVSDQLLALKDKNPEKDYGSLTPEVITREYRKEIIAPSLIKLIDKSVCIPGRSDAEKYEYACQEIIKWTLGEELQGGDPCLHLSTFLLDGFSRKYRDIVLPIPQITLSDKWESIKKEHHLKCIVFECKNYVETNPLTNSEIYQLFEYMNPGEYGTLGIVLSRYGKKKVHNNANSALNKIFNLNLEPKYRIIILGDDDLIEMINNYAEHGTCVNFLTKQIMISRSLPI